MKIFKKTLYNIFSIDIRSLAITRIALSIILIVDILIRSTDIVSQMTDAGIFSRVKVLSFWPDYISLHLLSGDLWFQIILFVIQFIFAIFLLIGYRTKLSTIVSWILLISVQARMPLILNAGDTIFRMTLFWGMFIPWGSYFSIDYLRGKQIIQKRYLSVASAGLLIQPVLMYVFTGLLKTGAAWHADGTAMWYALSNIHFITPLGEWLLKYPDLLTFITPTIVWFEIIGGLLLFVPIFTKQIRIILFILFALLQIGINVSMNNIGIFGPASVMALIPFLPGEFWTKLRIIIYKVQWKRRPVTIYYDNDCSFCYRGVRILKTLLLLPKTTEIKKASENSTIESIMNKEDSWVIADDSGKTYLRFEAFIKLCRSSWVWFLTPFLSLGIIRKIGDIIYRKVASSRMHICIPEIKKVPSLWKKYIPIIISSVALLYIIIININSLYPETKKIIPRSVNKIAIITRVRQHFSMFAPNPPLSNGWIVIRSTFEDGTLSNLFTGSEKVERHELNYDSPHEKSNVFKNPRWRKFFSLIIKSKYKNFRTPYLKYICRTWNSENEIHLDTVELMYFKQKINLPNEPEYDIEEKIISKYTCNNR